MQLCACTCVVVGWVDGWACVRACGQGRSSAAALLPFPPVSLPVLRSARTKREEAPQGGKEDAAGFRRIPELGVRIAAASKHASEWASGRVRGRAGKQQRGHKPVPRPAGAGRRW